MRYLEPDEPASPIDVDDTSTSKLRKENEELRRQLLELRGPAHHAPLHTGLPQRVWHPSRLTILAICLAVLVLFVIAFFAGYLPLEQRRTTISREARETEKALPRFEVVQVGRSPGKSELELPGNIQAITEAPVLARADGYVVRRLVDIGDRVRSGQLLAEIEAPELDEQVRQAKANLQQAQAALDQAVATLAQGNSDLELARVTAERWATLIKQDSVSQQENDVYQAQYRSKISNVHALEKGVVVQRNAVSGAEANLARLEKMADYRSVTAPFDGVITLRNVDSGALVNSASTLLFRIAQTGTLRTYVSVPQSDSDSIRAGQPAIITVSNLPGRQFNGTVARTANSLDPNSRTLLVEVRVPNNDGALMPGTYAQVRLISARPNPPLSVSSDSLILRNNGAQVAVVDSNHRVHLQKVEVGRDFGNRLEIVGGLQEGATIVANPGDVVSDGAEIQPIYAAAAGNP